MWVRLDEQSIPDRLVLFPMEEGVGVAQPLPVPGPYIDAVPLLRPEQAKELSENAILASLRPLVGGEPKEIGVVSTKPPLESGHRLFWVRMTTSLPDGQFIHHPFNQSIMFPKLHYYSIFPIACGKDIL